MSVKKRVDNATRQYANEVISIDDLRVDLIGTFSSRGSKLTLLLLVSQPHSSESRQQIATREENLNSLKFDRRRVRIRRSHRHRHRLRHRHRHRHRLTGVDS